MPPALPKRTIVIRIPPGINREQFLERLFQSLKAQTSLMKMEGDTVRIHVYGGETQIRDTLVAVKKLLNEYRVEKQGDRARLRREAIYRHAGLAIPLDVLVYAARRLGIDASIEGEAVTVREDNLDSLLDLASRLAEALNETRGFPLTTSGRKALAAASLVTGIDPLKLIEPAEAEGTLVEDDHERLTAAGSWKAAADRIIKLLRHDNEFSV